MTRPRPVLIMKLDGIGIPLLLEPVMAAVDHLAIGMVRLAATCERISCSPWRFGKPN